MVVRGTKAGKNIVRTMVSEDSMGSTTLNSLFDNDEVNSEHHKDPSLPLQKSGQNVDLSREGGNELGEDNARGRAAGKNDCVEHMEETTSIHEGLV